MMCNELLSYLIIKYNNLFEKLSKNKKLYHSEHKIDIFVQFYVNKS